MSNLIPTPIVDKNGVPSIRHKKQAADLSAAGRAIPPVAAPVSGTEHEPLSVEEIIDLLYPDRAEFPIDEVTIAREISVIREVSPEALHLVEELIPSGTRMGADLVRNRIGDLVTTITYARKIYGDRGNYQQTLNTAASLDMRELARVWNCGNVMEESGFTNDSGVPGRLRNVVEQEFRREFPRLDFENLTDKFWRGATAFTIIDKEYETTGLSNKEKEASKREFYRETQRFIIYAGKHKDIGLVIRTAKERDTIVVSELKEIIDQGNAAPSMRDGVL